MQQTAPISPVEGILHIADERQDGQLRDPLHPLRPLNGGMMVPRQMIRDLRLRPGVMVRGNPRGRVMGQIHTVEGRTPDIYAQTATMYDGTALDPEPQIRLEHNPTEFTTRIMDILCPIGFGQRGLILAP